MMSQHFNPGSCFETVPALQGEVIISTSVCSGRLSSLLLHLGESAEIAAQLHSSQLILVTIRCFLDERLTQMAVVSSPTPT